MMIAWAVVRAMEKHAPFRRLILDDDQIVQNDEFDLGVAVALEGDRLATAVITTANQKSWQDFVSNYNETVAATRGGRVDAMNIEPALSPTITRKLNRVIPANLQIDARWNAIQEARQASKKTDREQAPSPSMMIAWAVVRAMEKHAPFRRLILDDDQIVQNDEFDLGVAVALEGDRLATAVITTANQKSWQEFVSNYNETVAATRGGRVDAMNAPVVITSLGAFEVKAGAPIVVPPSVGTLFVGTAHRELISNKNKNESAEVITLSLTFDHRVVNGAGAAAFANEIKKQIEGFKIPPARMPAASADKR